MWAHITFKTLFLNRGGTKNSCTTKMRLLERKKINEKLDIPMRILTRFIQFFVKIKDFLSASQTIKILSQFHF